MSPLPMLCYRFSLSIFLPLFAPCLQVARRPPPFSLIRSAVFGSEKIEGLGFIGSLFPVILVAGVGRVFGDFELGVQLPVFRLFPRLFEALVWCL